MRTVLRALPAALPILAVIACSPSDTSKQNAAATPDSAAAATAAAPADGQRIFRFETFGDEQFWTDTRAHAGGRRSRRSSPTVALSVGFKVDADAIPPDVAQAIKSGQVDLKSPATTVALLKLNAVVGLQGTVNTVGGKDTLVRLGITCALCHSTVDNSFAQGIGQRKDGWPNRDLNVGAIIALSPARRRRRRRRSTTRGARGSMIPDSTSTARAHRSGAAAGVRPRPDQERDLHGRRARSPTGTRTSP